MDKLIVPVKHELHSSRTTQHGAQLVRTILIPNCGSSEE
jgi:hypothetical protein